MPVCKYCNIGKSTKEFKYDENKCFNCIERGINKTFYPQCECGRDIVPDKVHYCDVKVKEKEDVINKPKCKNCGKLTSDTMTMQCKECYDNECEDVINKPKHYHEGGIDVFTFGEANFVSTEMLGFYKLNVIKYLTRAGKKDDMLQDFKKAQKYMDKLVEFMEN